MEEDQDVNMNTPVSLVVFIDMHTDHETLAREIERATALRKFFPANVWIKLSMLPSICASD